MKVVLDWDGTVTETDVLNDVICTFGDELVYDRTEALLGDLTLNEVIAIEVQTVTAALEEVVEWIVGHARLRAGFREFTREHRPLVVSSGFHELIEPVLEREGLELEVRANRLDPRPDGWVALFRNEEPCPVCGERMLRPDVVWFGEMPYWLDEIDAALVACARFVAIGTSGAVHPAAGFVLTASAFGADTLELNLAESEITPFFGESRLGPASVLVPQWVDEVLAGRMSRG